jgi:hypothetical protein
MAKICDNFPKFLIVLDYAGTCHERESDCNFAIDWIGANVYVSIGSFIIAECKASEFDALVLPLPVDDVFLIEQPARDVDESYFQISLDLANS